MEIGKKLLAWFDATHLLEQIRDVDYMGLLTNPWFMVPFAAMLGYMVFRQKWKDLIIVGVLCGAWWVSGTPYMNSLIVNGELQIEKILPVVFAGAGAMGLVIYLLFGRSD